jgi:hypothetical protein
MQGECFMTQNPVLDVPLDQVMRPEIALPLRHVLQIYTVGQFLRSWKNPANHKDIEQLFDTPQQARHAVAVCAAWLGIRSPAQTQPPLLTGWWRNDDGLTAVA